MAERFQKRIDVAEARIPREILSKLAPYASNIEGLLRFPLDFRHGPLHISEVRTRAREIVDWMNISHHPPFNFEETEKLDLGVTFHDSGYVFCTPPFSVLKPREHHIGSWFIAKTLGLPDEVCWGILLHSRDSVPEHAPLWVHALNTADRISGMGYSGALREVYNIGVRDPIFEKPWENVDKLVDLRDIGRVSYSTRDRTVWEFPAHVIEEMTATDFESGVRKFFEDRVLPVLTSEQKKRLRKTFDSLIQRYDGWDKVSSILIDAMGLFEHKYFNTMRIYSEISGYGWPLEYHPGNIGESHEYGFDQNLAPARRSGTIDL